jgi:hypothetical protein
MADEKKPSVGSEDGQSDPERRESEVSSISQSDNITTKSGKSVRLSFIQHPERSTSAIPDKTLRSADELDQQKRRSNFYGEVFAYREPSSSVRETLTRDSVITVVMRTNVIVRHKYLDVDVCC